MTTAAHTFNISGTNTATLDSVSTISGPGFGITKAGTGTLASQRRQYLYRHDERLTAGTLKAGNANAATGGQHADDVTGSGLLDLNGNNATVVNTIASAATNTITDNSSGTGTSTFSETLQANTLSGFGNRWRHTQEEWPSIFPTITAESSILPATCGEHVFGSGLTLTYSNTNGTRLQINAPVTTAGSAGAITSGPFGTGPITLGQAATRIKAGIYFNTGANNNTLVNDIIFNISALGNRSAPAFAPDSSGHCPPRDDHRQPGSGHLQHQRHGVVLAYRAE